jgi:putative OPT family oligopeptide transporter
MANPSPFVPYVPSTSAMRELTLKALFAGSFFGLLFGASTVYLALKSGLTVSASIPIAVVSISLLKRFGGSTILENNLVQTIGSAGESIASGVAFTLPGFLFLATDAAGHSVGEPFFSYWTIFTLALLGGMLGTLMMIPLRSSLIVQEHGKLAYPEGSACASVLIAGERGGNLARTAYLGLAAGTAYAMLQKFGHVIAETPTWVSSQTSKFLPAATINGDITAEYLGVGYILGLRNASLLVAGGVLSWLGLIPLLATLAPADPIAAQLLKLGYQPENYGWNPATHTFSDLNLALYYAYVRQIGAGAVATGGFLTLIKTAPTIVSAFRGALASLRAGNQGQTQRTERDLPITFALGGSLALIFIIAFLPFIPGEGLGARLVLALLMLAFGFFFVTVSSRIVGLIGSSSNPISGMTIAAIMATCLVFTSFGWTGDAFQPMALCVGGIVCIAAANAGATSQDLKTGFLVGATPRVQQIGLIVGAVAAAFAIGITVQILDRPSAEMTAAGITHAIGTDRFPAPQGTLMATLIKGLLSFNLDWQFVLVGTFLAITIELCGASALAFAVGAYLPLSTTLPIFGGALVRTLAQRGESKHHESAESDELGAGSLFSTGLVAGGALVGVFAAALYALADATNSAGTSAFADFLDGLNIHPQIVATFGQGGYDLLSVGWFLGLATLLYFVARKSTKKD